MVLVVRGEIRLTAGKAAVQVAHGAVLLCEAATRHHARELDAWRSEGAKKIALVAPTLPEMEELQRAARAKGLPTVMVEDAGLTEVPPGTRTVLGIGPGLESVSDPITRHLPLL